MGFAILGAVAWGGCGGSAATPTSGGVLTDADLPASMGLAGNHSATAVNLGKAFGQAYPGCAGHFAVFTVDGRTPTPVSSGTTISPEVFSEAARCRSSDQAAVVFRHTAGEVEANNVGGTPVTGVGTGAVVASMDTKRANEYAIFWEDGTSLGFVQLSGPVGDRAITVGEIEVLARRQIARR